MHPHKLHYLQNMLTFFNQSCLRNTFIITIAALYNRFIDLYFFVWLLFFCFLLNILSLKCCTVLSKVIKLAFHNFVNVCSYFLQTMHVKDREKKCMEEKYMDFLTKDTG